MATNYKTNITAYRRMKTQMRLKRKIKLMEWGLMAGYFIKADILKP
ncbi:MAG: hypothetical protein JWQ38_2212 [Flavipsychrobacter sp.]|nr:hypothetical protein [Flavipsychrobacter sp.]